MPRSPTSHCFFPSRPAEARVSSDSGAGLNSHKLSYKSNFMLYISKTWCYNASQAETPYQFVPILFLKVYGIVGMLRSWSQNGPKPFRLTRGAAGNPAIIAIQFERTHWRSVHNTTPPWRPASTLDEYISQLYDWNSLANQRNRWVAKEARPISLRQLMVFGRSLTEARLISSANYVRTELPTRCVYSPSLKLYVHKLIGAADWHIGSATCKHSRTLWSPTLT